VYVPLSSLWAGRAGIPNALCTTLCILFLNERFVARFCHFHQGDPSKVFLNHSLTFLFAKCVLFQEFECAEFSNIQRASFVFDDYCASHPLEFKTVNITLNAYHSKATITAVLNNCISFYLVWFIVPEEPV